MSKYLWLLAAVGHILSTQMYQALNKTSKYLCKAKMNMSPEKTVFFPFCLYRSNVKRQCSFALLFRNDHHVLLSELGNMEHNCCWGLHFYPDHPFTTCCHGYFRLSGAWEKGKGQTSLCSLELQEESLKPKAPPVALPEELLPNDSHSNHSWLLLIFN